MVEELDAHRRGRGRLIAQYQQLEAELSAERTRSRGLSEQLAESQDRAADLKRELWAQTEKAKRLQQRIEQDACEKEALSDKVIGLEQRAEGLQADVAHLDARVEQYE